MAKIINLDERRAVCPYMLPFIEPRNILTIQAFKSKVGLIMGYNYLSSLIGVALKGKNIIGKDNIKNDSLPYNIEVQVERLDKNDLKKLASEISEAIKKTKIVKIKEQLFYLRNKILLRTI